MRIWKKTAKTLIESVEFDDRMFDGGAYNALVSRRENHILSQHLQPGDQIIHEGRLYDIITTFTFSEHDPIRWRAGKVMLGMKNVMLGDYTIMTIHQGHEFIGWKDGDW